MRKFYLLSILLLTGMLFSACVPSINPISAKNEVSYSDLSGRWQMDGSIFTVEDGKDEYLITQYDGKGNLTARMRMILSKIGNETYASISCDTRSEAAQKALQPYQDFLVPIWRLYRFEKNGDVIYLYWTNDTFKSGAVRGISGFSEKDSFCFSASSAELKEWIGKNTAFFDAQGTKNSFVFKRTK